MGFCLLGGYEGKNDEVEVEVAREGEVVSNDVWCVASLQS